MLTLESTEAETTFNIPPSAPPFIAEDSSTWICTLKWTGVTGQDI